MYFQNIVKKLGMSTEVAQHFALFEMEEYNFGKKTLCKFVFTSKIFHNNFFRACHIATNLCLSTLNELLK